MKFHEAFKSIITSEDILIDNDAWCNTFYRKIIRHKSWNKDSVVYICTVVGCPHLMKRTSFGTYPWTPNQEELFSDNWEVSEETYYKKRGE